MSGIQLKQNPAVQEKFDNYPEHIRPKMEDLRALILETASESATVNRLEETLKWGEPSYLAPKGSTVRIDWKTKKPEQIAIYFKCTSKLVPTIQTLYGDLFTYETTRAIVFKLDQTIPETELKDCIDMALNYHRVKNLPLLGR